MRKQLSIPLGKLIHELNDAALDDQGNWILARRTPDDTLRVVLEPNRTVLAVNERLSMKVEPHLLPVEAGTTVRLTSTWVRGRGSEELNSLAQDLVAAESGGLSTATFAVDTPSEEGVYTVKLVASHRAKLRWRQNAGHTQHSSRGSQSKERRCQRRSRK